MKMRIDTKKIYLAMAGKGLTATEIAKQGGVSVVLQIRCTSSMQIRCA